MVSVPTWLLLSTFALSAVGSALSLLSLFLNLSNRWRLDEMEDRLYEFELERDRQHAHVSAALDRIEGKVGRSRDKRLPVEWQG